MVCVLCILSLSIQMGVGSNPMADSVVMSFLGPRVRLLTLKTALGMLNN